ncbi:ABC transporter substrate-binding protein [Candidatus Atribacteria bacterium 1244-E10-H5-B2]|jgi:branched-chain amino acid transport system substrate-binding protein|nr:MAG: ABC transporter substrate-binding protein [Candidatus Atribacteria bacterium 1244-E10-H5-B2]
MKKFGLIVGVLVSFLLVFSLVVGAAEEIVIGVYEPMTGPYAAGGQMTMEGVNLAFEQQPTVLGKPIKMVLVDNKSEKVEAANAVARLIEFEKAVAIVGTYGSACAIPGSEVANKAGVPMMGCSPTNPLVTLGKPYAFRACFIDPFQGAVMANFAVSNLNAKTAVVIQDIASDYAVGLSNFFREAFIKLTGNPKSIIGLISYQTGDQDFTAQVTYAAGKNPDVVFVPAGSYGDAALILKQGKEMGITANFLGGDTWEAPEFIEVGGEAVEGSYFSTHFDATAVTTKAAEKFCKDFEKKYNRSPSAFAALGFDAYNLVLDAIKRAGSADPKAIRDALAATKDYEGCTGMITLDLNGDATKDAIIKTVENSKFKYIATVTPF